MGTSSRQLTGRLKEVWAAARRDPHDFAERLRRRAATTRAPGRDDSAVSRSAHEVVEQLRSLAPGARIGVVGDSAILDMIRESMEGVSLTWLSIRSVDLANGADRIDVSTLAPLDAIVVGGPDVATAWVAVLRQLPPRLDGVRVLWCGENWERAGSRVPVPTQAADAECFLYQHFADYFGQKDPLLVRRTVHSPGGATTDWAVLRPGETWWWSLRDLTDTSGPHVVEVDCEHPRLSNGRHRRWRLAADIRWRDSETALHGSHDYRPTRSMEARRPSRDFYGSVALLCPTYAGPVDEPAHFQTARGERTAATAVLSEYRLHTDGNDRCWGYRMKGSGTPYVFRFGDVEGLSGNHEVSVPIRSRRHVINNDAQRHLDRLRECDFHPHVHPLPHLVGSGLTFAVELSAANPDMHHLDVGVPSDRGIAWTTVAVDRSLPTSVHLTHGRELGGATTVLVAPAWRVDGLDPRDFLGAIDLVVVNEAGDVDFTEFQSCWRNLGVVVDSHPHWITVPQGVVGRTNVLMRYRRDGDHRTGVVLTNGSGWGGYHTPATAHVSVTGERGETLSYDVELAPWASMITFPADHIDTPEIGAVRVVSYDADLNCQVVTLSGSSVSLQHMWGY